MDHPQLSVVVCAHNPRSIYLKRVIEALERQTLPRPQWELLLVDNASNEPLAGNWDLSWHARGRHIREEVLGLTPARIRGVRESAGECLVFVDDDNVLDPDYLERAVEIAQLWPHIGAWGGRVLPEFECEPPEWTRAFWPNLAVRDFNGDRWSNLLHQYQTTPCGAGMIVRRSVAEEYARNVMSDPRRLELDRKGTDLASCGDCDLAFTAIDKGFGTGQFTALNLIHLISAGRLSEAYLLKLVERNTFSAMVLESLRGTFPAPVRTNFLARLRKRLRLLRMDARGRMFEMARIRGEEAARIELASEPGLDLRAGHPEGKPQDHGSINSRVRSSDLALPPKGPAEGVSCQ